MLQNSTLAAWEQIYHETCWAEMHQSFIASSVVGSHGSFMIASLLYVVRWTLHRILHFRFKIAYISLSSLRRLTNTRCDRAYRTRYFLNLCIKIIFFWLSKTFIWRQIFHFPLSYTCICVLDFKHFASISAGLRRACVCLTLQTHTHTHTHTFTAAMCRPWPQCVHWLLLTG